MLLVVCVVVIVIGAACGAITTIRRLGSAGRRSTNPNAGPRETETGVRRGSIRCPKCGEIVDTTKPKATSREATRYGYICTTCGQSMDSQGRARAR